MIFKPGNIVIFVDTLNGPKDANNNTVPINRVGIVERAYKYRKRARVYNIRAENGSLYMYTPVDEHMSKITISSSLTARIASRIVTKLSLTNSTNYAGA